MNFLSLENYMQVDFPNSSFGGLKSFASRIYGDPKKFTNISKDID